MNSSRLTFWLIIASLSLSSCHRVLDYLDHHRGPSDDVEAEFTVTIENVFAGKDFFAAGTTGFIEPGMSQSYAFNAGPGHYLSFATMFVQSNDLFYGPDMNGIALYDGDGAALTGDITGLIDLWDAGTEVNEAPGVGDNQAPRQTGPDTGAAENGTVQLVADVNDGFTYPTDEEIIQVTLEHDGGTLFTLTISNISNTSTLPTPFAPGVWVAHFGAQTPLFQTGEAASPGLERIAEDGDNAMMDANLSGRSGLVSPFAPGAFSVAAEGHPIFHPGDPASDALEALAEDGDPSGFDHTFSIPDGASGPAPIFPGESYSFQITAQMGDRLSFATMLVQSNDWFIGTKGLALFTDDGPLHGDITDQLRLYDSSTEIDEYPGAGRYQAPRQPGPDSGPAEDGNVERETGAFGNLPEVANMVKVTVVPVN